MNLLLTILFGALVGWLASLITHRDAEQGWLGNIVVGILGSLLGLWVAHSFGDAAVGFWSAFLWSLAGAVLLCVGLNLVTHRRIR